MRINAPGFKLVCDKEEVNYVTHPNDAVEIQNAIAAIYPDVKVFVDAFACVGGDTMATAFIHNHAKIIAVQRVMVEKEVGRFQRLQHNVSTFQSYFHRRNIIECRAIDVAGFLSSYQEPISVLFLDPPWAVGKDPVEISPVNEILEFLQTDVFTKLTTLPSVICIKLPKGELIRWNDILQNEYQLHTTLKPRDRYGVYIFTKNKIEE